MIASINSFVSKVVSTVKSPISVWRPKAKKTVCKTTKKACKGKKCKCS